MNIEAASVARTRTGGIRPLQLIAALVWTASLMPSLSLATSVEEDGAVIRPWSSEHLDAASQYASMKKSEDHFRVTARFQDFNGEEHAVGFDLNQSENRAAMQEFGYSREELDSLRDACNASASCDQQQLTAVTMRYYRDHALRATPNPGKATRLTVDVAAVVSRNLGRVQPVAAALQSLAAEQGYDRQWMIEAAIAMVQSGLPYRRPPSTKDGRNLLGFYPPLMALERGYGDCDTKSALLAAILMNLGEKQIIGVHVPDHYLLGIVGTPRPGEASIEHDGQTYVLVEAAGPARRQPGEVSDFTKTALARQTGIRVDPMF